jgi:hypothetical protein
VRITQRTSLINDGNFTLSYSVQRVLDNEELTRVIMDYIMDSRMDGRKDG